MKSEYGIQVKAFFHFMFKHLFEVEFGIRVAIEILIFVVLVYVLLKICNKIISKSRAHIAFINRELVLPLRVRLFEKLAFSTSNPNWQERANKIKDDFKEKKDEYNKKNNKSHIGCWIIIYLVLTTWIIGFYYYGEEKRSNYEVFFLGEKAILAFEEWTTNSLFNTDEKAIECFFHDKIEMDSRDSLHKEVPVK